MVKETNLYISYKALIEDTLSFPIVEYPKGIFVVCCKDQFYAIQKGNFEIAWHMETKDLENWQEDFLRLAKARRLPDSLAAKLKANEYVDVSEVFDVD